MAQQHDVNQGDKFPEEIHDVTREMKDLVRDDGINTIDKRNGNPHGDQSHHGRLFTSQFSLSTTEEGGTTINKNDCSQNGDEQISPRMACNLERQVNAHHGAHDNDGDGENEGYPEFAFEIAHVHHVSPVHHHIVGPVVTHSHVHIHIWHGHFVRHVIVCCHLKSSL